MNLLFNAWSVLATSVLIPVAMVALDFTEDVWPALALVLPLIQAVITRYSATSDAKMLISFGVAAAAALISVVSMEWAEITPELLATRGAVIWVSAKAAFHLADETLKKTSDTGLNKQRVVAPTTGIG